MLECTPAKESSNISPKHRSSRGNADLMTSTHKDRDVNTSGLSLVPRVTLGQREDETNVIDPMHLELLYRLYDPSSSGKEIPRCTLTERKQERFGAILPH